MTISVTRKLAIELNLDTILFFLWQLAFGWLLLFYRGETNSNGRALKTSPYQLLLPMKAQTAFAMCFVVAGLAGVIFFSAKVYQDNQRVDKTANTQSVPVPPGSINLEGVSGPSIAKSPPTRLRIPAVSIDTGFVELGRQADGTMQVPEAYDVAGWYKYAPTPGEIGPAIIAGHVDNYRGAAVFYRLKELNPGDVIEVSRADGSTVKFKVDSVKQFSQSNFPTQEVYGNINFAGLRLITCGGQFNSSTQQYSDNTVVFASLIS